MRQPGSLSTTGRKFKPIASRGTSVKKNSRSLILTALYLVGEMSFLRLQREWGYTRGNLSSHLRKLERAGYVAVKKKFKNKYPATVCSLTKAGREALDGYARMLKLISGVTKSPKSGRPRNVSAARRANGR